MKGEQHAALGPSSSTAWVGVAALSHNAMPHRSPVGTFSRTPNRVPSRTVFRKGNKIRFVDKVNSFTHGEYMWWLNDCRTRGYEDIILDFSTCNRAYPDGMIPLLADVDALRRDGVNFSVDLPRDDKLKRLFLNTNWAHILEPRY